MTLEDLRPDQTVWWFDLPAHLPRPVQVLCVLPHEFRSVIIRIGDGAPEGVHPFDLYTTEAEARESAVEAAGASIEWHSRRGAEMVAALARLQPEADDPESILAAGPLDAAGRTGELTTVGG